ncbi:MAG: alkaline phosphatase family protein [Geminicoccaceae bacterium]
MGEGADPPTVVIGIDAAEITLIDRLVARGRLPVIAGLRESGSRAILTPQHGGLQSSVWRSFISGRHVGAHGVYFAKMWRPERMRLEYIDNSWRPVVPFWERVDRPLRVGLVDVPYLPPRQDFDGVLLSGWQCHDVLPKVSWPPELFAQSAQRFGQPVLGDEPYGAQTPDTLEQARLGALAAPAQIADISCDLLARNAYDLFVVVLGSAHRAGHYLWDLSQIDPDSLTDDQRVRLERAVEDVYEACDAAIGRIVAAAPPGARIVLLAMHGMGRNLGWNENVQALLELAAGEPPRRRPAWREQVNAALRSPAGRQLAGRIPARAQRMLSPLWTRRSRDWSRTRYFALPSDVNAYIRLNLAGRELEGIVPPTEAPTLAERLTEGFLELEDIETGRPVCAQVALIDEVAGPDSPARQGLPDLVVQWNETPLLGSSGVRHRRGGERRWPAVRRYVCGRSGNHRPDGWLIASGPGIPQGADLGRVAALDAIATLAAWSGHPADDGLDGTPLPSLFGG